MDLVSDAVSAATDLSARPSGGAMAPCFWRVPDAELLRRLDTGPQGISASEAALRLKRDGPNTPVVQHGRSLAARFAKKLIEPLVAILICAAVASGATGDWPSFVIIVTIVMASVTLDVVQEHRATLAAEALKRSVAVKTAVRRDGRVVDVPVEDLAAGDVVELRLGDLVPADGVILAGRDCRANEALLTGEPYPVEKRPGPSASDEPAAAFNALFGGTSIVSGEAAMLVVATGARTRFGGIAAALQANQPPTAFERGIHALGSLILRLTVFLVLFVLLAHVAFGRAALESFLFAVALAVGLTPELLPMVMTVALSRGALRMAARRVVVKRLSAIHDLGSMDVLCTDKTGTLTQARIALAAHPGIDGVDSARVLELAALNCGFASGMRSVLDDAVLSHPPAVSLEGWRKLDDLPFDFERRRASVLAERAGERVLVAKGAPEELLAICAAAETAAGGIVPLDAALRTRLDALHDGLAAQGFRLLGVASRRFDDGRDHVRAEDEADLVFAGFCVFLDPPKPSATRAAARLAQAGIRVKVISGDAEAVVRHLVGSLGIPAEGVLSGKEIGALSQPALEARVDAVDLFVRVSPDQKMRVVRALQARGHTVGFLGDGINDAPSIRAADVGLSVDGATDVAREAADMILLESDLGVLADGVEEGRRTYNNIMKYVRMGTSSNFGNMISMAIASLVLPFLPLTPIQILLNNLLYDLSEVGIPFDDVDADEVREPHGWDMRDVLRFTLVMGPLSSLFDLATFAILRLGFGADVDQFRTAWFVESIATQILVVFLIRTRKPAWASRPHLILAATSLGALATALVVALTPIGHLLGFAGLPLGLLAAIAGLVVTYLVAAEGLKPFALRRAGPRPAPRG